jgi:four helix bundle protein
VKRSEDRRERDEREITPHEERPTSHAHPNANANADERGEIGRHVAGPFPHEKLDAYQVALEMAALAKKVAERIPRGHRNVADHMLRAASNTVLLLAEGANRRGPGEKCQRFAESRGECAELGAAGDLLLAYDIGPRADADSLKRLASRVSAMLTRLIARLQDERPMRFPGVRASVRVRVRVRVERGAWSVERERERATRVGLLEMGRDDSIFKPFVVLEDRRRLEVRRRASR